MTASLALGLLGFFCVVIALGAYVLRTGTFGYLPGQKLPKVKPYEAIFMVVGWLMIVLAVMI